MLLPTFRTSLCKRQRRSHFLHPLSPRTEETEAAFSSSMFTLQSWGRRNTLSLALNFPLFRPPPRPPLSLQSSPGCVAARSKASPSSSPFFPQEELPRWAEEQGKNRPRSSEAGSGSGGGGGGGKGLFSVELSLSLSLSLSSAR